MPRGDAAQKRLREEQREKILEGAQKVFARKGMAATMDDIAAEASVSHGLAYRYFANKEAIFYTLAKRAFEANPMPQLIRELSGTPGERLEQLVSQLIESRQHPEFYLLFDQMLKDEAIPDELRELVRERGRLLREGLRQLIVEGQDAGEVVEGDPDQLVRAILASADGLTRWALYDPEGYLEHFPDAGIFLRMLKP